MFRRVIRRGAILGVTLLIAAIAYVQGYTDRDQNRPLGLIAAALAAEKATITPTQ